EEHAALFSMIEHQSVWARLGGELRLAISDFTHNPQSFLRDIISSDKKDSERSRRIRNGLILAVAAHIVIGGLLAILSRHSSTIKKSSEESDIEVKILQFPSPKPVVTKPTFVAIKPDTKVPPVTIPQGESLKAGG